MGRLEIREREIANENKRSSNREERRRKPPKDLILLRALQRMRLSRTRSVSLAGASTLKAAAAGPTGGKSPAHVAGPTTSNIGPQLSVRTTEAPLAFFLIDSMPFRQASLDL